MSPPALVVVGAGIIGCMVAREIAARNPSADTMLLDQEMVGSGASRRSAGLHVPGGGTPRIRRMAAYSQDHYQRLRQSDPTVPIHPLGMTVVAAESSASRLREIYLDVAGLSRTDRVPNAAVRIPPGAGAWQVQGAQYADVHALTQAVARELRPHVAVREGVRVTGVEGTDDDVAVRLGTGETLHPGQVVLTPGPWIGASAWRTLVAPLGVRVKKIAALHVERRPAADDHAVFFPDEDAFLLPLPRRGHWLFSYTCQEWDVDPNAPMDGLSTADLAEARRCLSRYAPALVEHCTSGRVFCDAYSPDREPLVRTLDEPGRIVFAGAGSGSGYRLAPAIASEAADLLHLPSKVWSHS
jgi:D-arginine dehydrogenase